MFSFTFTLVDWCDFFPSYFNNEISHSHLSDSPVVFGKQRGNAVIFVAADLSGIHAEKLL